MRGGEGGVLASRQALLDDIVAGIAPEEWAALEREPCELPVNDFNRATLLRLRELGFSSNDHDAGRAERLRKLDSLQSEVDAERVELLRSQLATYLDEQLPDRPTAHRYIISSCIGLAFILNEPMHPIERVNIHTRTIDGETTYYCPARENQKGSLCRFCACRSMDGWEDDTYCNDRRAYGT